MFTPSPEKLQRIAEALGVPFNELIDPTAELEVNNLVVIVQIFIERKEYEEALQHIAELENRGDVLQHQKQDVILYKAEALMRVGRTDEAVGLLSTLRTELDKVQADEHLVAEVFNRLGNAYLLGSNISYAHAHYVRAHQVSLTFPVYDELAAKISYNLGRVCSWITKPTEAAEHLEKAEAYFRSIPDRVKLADTLFAQGLCYRDLNKLEQPEKYLNESLTIYKSQNLCELAQHVKYNLACLVTAQKQFDTAIEELIDCADHFKEMQLLPKVAYTYVKIAELYLDKDRTSDAHRFLAEANSILTTRDFPKYDHDNVFAFYYKVIGRVLYNEQKYEEAIAMAFKSSDLFGKMGVTREEADSLEVAVDSYVKLGDSDAAIQLSRRISDLLRHSLDTFTNPEV